MGRKKKDSPGGDLLVNKVTVILSGNLPVVWVIWTVLLLAELAAIWMHWDLQRRLAKRGIEV